VRLNGGAGVAVPPDIVDRAVLFSATMARHIIALFLDGSLVQSREMGPPDGVGSHFGIQASSALGSRALSDQEIGELYNHGSGRSLVP
jgi:hypothetical protein